MNTKNLPQTIHSFALAHTEQLITSFQLFQLLVLVFLSLLSLHQPIRAVSVHPTHQPAPYEQLADTQQFEVLAEVPLAKIATRPTTPKAVSSPLHASTDIAHGFALIKQCESGGNYRAVNSAGYYGAYQFNPGTWNSTANAAGRPDLVGVRPDAASPADQDAMAYKLHSLRGWQPWGCARHVGLM